MFIRKRIRINDYIRSSEVRVIGSDGEQLGVLDLAKAKELAEEQGLDLVEISPTAKPPVCRVMDYSKYKYDQEKKERLVKKKQKVTHLKQLRIKPRIDDHDYSIKLKQAIGFLNKKDKVKINLFFRGREMAFREQGYQVLKKFIADTVEYGDTEKEPSMEGRVMSIVISPKSEKK